LAERHPKGWIAPEHPGVGSSVVEHHLEPPGAARRFPRPEIVVGVAERLAGDPWAPPPPAGAPGAHPPAAGDLQVPGGEQAAQRPRVLAEDPDVDVVVVPGPPPKGEIDGPAPRDPPRHLRGGEERGHLGR